MLAISRAVEIAVVGNASFRMRFCILGSTKSSAVQFSARRGGGINSRSPLALQQVVSSLVPVPATSTDSLLISDIGESLVYRCEGAEDTRLNHQRYVVSNLAACGGTEAEPCIFPQSCDASSSAAAILPPPFPMRSDDVSAPRRPSPFPRPPCRRDQVYFLAGVRLPIGVSPAKNGVVLRRRQIPHPSRSRSVSNRRRTKT